MSQQDLLNEIHNKLTELFPEDASHEEANRPFSNDNSYGGGDTMTETKTYTEDELSAAVEAALAPVKEAADAIKAQNETLESEIESLRAANEAEEVEDAVESAKAETDRAEARAAAAEQELAELKTWLDEQAELEEIATYLEDLKAERLEVVKEASALSDEYIEGRIDRWVAMSDDDFAALVEDLKVAASASESSSKSEEAPASETAMSNTRPENAEKSVSAKMIYAAAREGVDIRRL